MNNIGRYNQIILNPQIFTCKSRSKCEIDIGKLITLLMDIVSDLKPAICPSYKLFYAVNHVDTSSRHLEGTKGRMTELGYSPPQ